MWVKYYEARDGREKTDLMVVTDNGDVTVLDTRKIAAGPAQKWVADGLCKRLGIIRAPAGSAAPKSDFQGGE